MSNSDQQYPYDPGHAQHQGQQSYDPSHGQQEHRPAHDARPAQDAAYDGRPPQQPVHGQQSYDPAHGQQGRSGYDQAAQAAAYGQPAQPAYGQQQPYGQQQGQQRPYAQQQSYGQQQGQQRPYAQQQSYGQQQDQQQPYAQQQPAVYPEQGVPRAPADQGVTQTWQGQTWDTQYQPTVQPQHRAAPVAPAAPAAQSSQGAYPLPPEAPVAPAAPPAPATPDARAAASAHADYSAPSTLGNSRITDAQRARAEGRSPIIAPGMQPAAITAGLGLLLALGAAIGAYALLVPLVLLQAVTAAGWFRLNGMWPARQGIMLAFAGGVVADAALLAAGRSNAPAAILGTLGVWVLLTLVLQLRSRAGADERMYGLTATVASAALAVLAAGHLAAVPDAVTVGGVAVAAAVLVRALPLPGPASVVVALLASAGAGLAAGVFTDFGAQSALLGFAAGGCALIGLRVASYDYPSRFVHMTAGVALPLTAAAPAVYLIGRAIA
ncbi:hypothetical protein [Streptomyces sp. HB132]|uniref:hypothetical protein n=1 Tax=Streptomyces sp. HB132 TaxID=767388 RepID=UPI001961BA98|nr:hypothetical protein [Streptomyces sp. HB132]MBM7436686.1 hypothetical protein [Streptomyces sp. HB132]